MGRSCARIWGTHCVIRMCDTSQKTQPLGMSARVPLLCFASLTRGGKERARIPGPGCHSVTRPHADNDDSLLASLVSNS